MTEPIRWSTGLQATPQQYVKLGRLIGALELAEANAPDLSGLGATPAETAALEEILAEIEAGEQEAWDSGTYEDELAALEAEAAALLGREPRDLSNGPGGELDLSTLDFSAIEGARQQDVRMTRWTGLARGVLHGDLTAMAEAYAQAGSAGHKAVGLAWEYGQGSGSDARSIELSRYEGRFAHTCSAPDSLGRCSARYHASECAHNAEAAAARGATPEDARGWQAALQRHASAPLADSQGRVFRDQHGQAMTAAGHIEALSGQRHGESPFLGDRRTRRELVSPQRQRVLGDPSADPGSPEAYGAGFTPGTAATARALAAQAHLPVSADALRQRQAQVAEHDRRVADRASRTSGRVHPDFAESTRERAERLHQPVGLSNVGNDDLLGALPSFTYGQL